MVEIIKRNIFHSHFFFSKLVVILVMWLTFWLFFRLIQVIFHFFHILSSNLKLTKVLLNMYRWHNGIKNVLRFLTFEILRLYLFFTSFHKNCFCVLKSRIFFYISSTSKASFMNSEKNKDLKFVAKTVELTKYRFSKPFFSNGNFLYSKGSKTPTDKIVYISHF